MKTNTFDYAEGAYTYVVQASDVGTIYFVCKFHAAMGMKGKIVVTTRYETEH